MNNLNNYIPTQEDYAYIAGLLEAEGSFLIKRDKSPDNESKFKYRPLICIAMREKESLEFLYKVFGGNIKEYSKIYSITYRENKLREILPKIYPYLTLKKSQADYLIEILNIKEILHTNQDMSHIYEEIRNKLCSSRDGSQLLLLNDINNKELDSICVSYIAGLIDGEGSFGIYNHVRNDSENYKYNVRAKFSISMNNWEGLYKVVQITGGKLSKHKKAYIYSLGDNIINGKLHIFLNRVIPFLRLKKKQAEICKYFIENKDNLNSQQEQDIIKECKVEKNNKQVGERIIRPIKIYENLLDF